MCSVKERPYYSLMLILKRKGVTQSELAELIGVSKKTLSLKMWGKHAFRFREIQTIAKFLNISEDSID